MITIKDVSYKYELNNAPVIPVLKNISLDIQAGESIAIMGPNGSGKSTFVRCLNGLLVPKSGHVVVNGFATDNPENWIAIRKLVGMVFQNPDNQIVSATVEREIAFGLENLGIPYNEMHATVENMLGKFDLEKYRRKSPHYLSGGEKQKLAIASVLAMNPEYLVMDEPTSLLDPQGRREILQIIRDLHEKHGENSHDITTILVTQFPEETLSAGRLLIFNGGEIIADDEPSEIFLNYRHLEDIGLEAPAVFKIRELLKDYL